MGNLSRLLVVAAAGVLIVGCGTPQQRYGKGNDHEVANLNNRTVYVEKEPRIVYVQQPVVQPAPTVVYYQPAPVYTTSPAYSTTPVYTTPVRVVPVTRYYYSN